MHSAHWRHDRNSFFKYTTSKTALSILTTRTLRWSASHVFNDPFDLQFDMPLIIEDAVQMRRAILDYLWEAHYSPDGLPAGNLLGELIKWAHPIFPKMSREEFDKQFGEAVDVANARLPHIIKSQFHPHFHALMSDAKILCFSERNDNILMWSHYSDSHQGVVLEFSCLPEVDSAWGAAIPVTYAEMPRVYDEDFLIRVASGQASLASEDEAHKLIRKFITAKAIDWAYEREWRVVLFRTDPNVATQDLRFDQRELAAVYLGCNMSDTEKGRFSRMVTELYPDTKIYFARKMKSRFALEFHELPIL